MRRPQSLFAKLSMLAFAATVFCSSSIAFAQDGGKYHVAEVYHNDNFQLTGITVSHSGRLFINFPRWSDQYLNAVIEVMPDGSTKPYPDEQWNQWDMRAETAAQHFVCVQSVVADGDSLWAVDAAAPLLGPVIPGGPKLVQIDLKSNKVVRVIPFGPEVAKPSSYMNDIRFDDRDHTAYLTDSGAGGIVIVDLQSGKARRALDGNPSVLVEKGVQIVIAGKPVQRNGQPPQINSDSIALSPDGQYLYYKALTADTLYRIKTHILRDASASPSQVSAAVEKLGKTFPTDGFWMDAKGNLYLSDLDNNAVVERTPDGKMQRMVSDPRLVWPDTFTQGPDGTIYITASHINEGPAFNQGVSTRKQPYAAFKIVP
jgi:sugar lactone lactonase YvrE